jgi:hypothetical protein
MLMSTIMYAYDPHLQGSLDEEEDEAGEGEEEEGEGGEGGESGKGGEVSYTAAA